MMIKKSMLNKSSFKEEKNLCKSTKFDPIIPAWLVWIQCVAFVVLYTVWILPEIVGFRNAALVVGMLASLYSIYQYRFILLQKSALSIWCIIVLFIWTIVHLLFFSQDYELQLIELKRIWKYTAISSIFALGLGLSLASKNFLIDTSSSQRNSQYWPLILFGLTTPLLIYLIKYGLTTYGAKLGIEAPIFLRIYFSSQPYYIPKSDYVAFCLPPLAIALGQIYILISRNQKLMLRDYGKLFVYLSIIKATLFLFYTQNIKNGIAYSIACIGLFIILILLKKNYTKWWKKKLIIVVVVGVLSSWTYPHIQKNDSWETLVEDVRIAFQTEKYQHWKYAGEQGYPKNEIGKTVSITNYERAAWLKIGTKLAFQNPFGYGLIEDSFKFMVKSNWSDASLNLSHTHSGWLDLVLAIGLPGFFLVMGALLSLLYQSRNISNHWHAVVFWGLIANAFLWITVEASSTILFPALIFWLCFSAGICICLHESRLKSI